MFTLTLLLRGVLQGIALRVDGSSSALKAGSLGRIDIQHGLTSVEVLTTKVYRGERLKNNITNFTSLFYSQWTISYRRSNHRYTFFGTRINSAPQCLSRQLVSTSRRTCGMTRGCLKSFPDSIELLKLISFPLKIKFGVARIHVLSQ